MRQVDGKDDLQEVDLPGPLLQQYHREREIGRGEYGNVYLAKRLGAYYALKVVRLAGKADAARAEAYARELRGVRLVMGLPPIEGLVRIHDLAESADGTEFAYVMDLADPEREEIGPFDDNYRPRTLASVIDAEIALPLGECIEIGIRIASVLAALQRLHVIHRDIKPGNIIFVRGKVVLADVGLAIDVRDAASIVGTPGYAPPERQGSPAGDVFGLGKTLYSISTGRRPSEEGLPPCAEADIDAPFFWKWMVILAKATARDPAQRYRSAKGFLKDLRRLRNLHSPKRRKARVFLFVLVLVPFFAFLIPAFRNAPDFMFWLEKEPGYQDRLPLPFPYSMFRAALVSNSAPPYPYDLSDDYVEDFMIKEVTGDCPLIDWSDWSDNELKTETVRAHLLAPMHGRKRDLWFLPRRVVLSGDTSTRDDELDQISLSEEEKNKKWQEYMRSPLSNVNGER